MNRKDGIHNILSYVSLVIVITLGLMSIIATGGDSGGDGGSEVGTQSISVRIVDCWSNEPLNGVSVVLGDSNCTLVTTGETDINGMITFSNVPDNATVTATYSYTNSWDDKESFLESIIGVNISNVTICIDTYDISEIEVGEVNITITNLPDNLDHWEIEPTWDYVSNGETSKTITIYEYDMQKDGKLTIIVYGYDQNDNLICYGIAQNISFSNGQSTIDQTIDISNTNFSQMSITANNIPNTAIFTTLDVDFERQEVFYRGANANFNEPINSTIIETFNLVSGLWDNCHVQALLEMDDDTFQIIDKTTPTLSDTSIDFNSAIPFPNDISIINTYSATPTLNWSGGTAAADLIRIEIYTYHDGKEYNLCLEMPAHKTNTMIPELPDSLSSFRPNNFNVDEFDHNEITYVDINFINGWNNYLNTIHNFHSGEFTVPNSFTNKVSGRSFDFSCDAAKTRDKIMIEGDSQKIIKKRLRRKDIKKLFF